MLGIWKKSKNGAKDESQEIEIKKDIEVFLNKIETLESSIDILESKIEEIFKNMNNQYEETQHNFSLIIEEKNKTIAAYLIENMSLKERIDQLEEDNKILTINNETLNSDILKFKEILVELGIDYE